MDQPLRSRAPASKSPIVPEAPLARAVRSALSGVTRALAARVAPVRNEATPCTPAHPGAPGCTHGAEPQSQTDPPPAPAPGRPAPSDAPSHGAGAVRPPRAPRVVQNEATPRTRTHRGAPWRTLRDAEAVVREHLALDPRQVMAARLLLTGRRTCDVAAALGVTRHAVTRWKRDPRFQAEVRRLVLELEPAPHVGRAAEVEMR